MSLKSILYLCSEIPFPPVSGDKIRNANIIRLLAEHFQIDLLAYEPVAREGMQSAAVVPANCRLHTVPSVDYKSWSLRLRSVLLRRNNSLVSHADLHFSILISQLTSNNQYDYIVLGHSFLGHLLPLFRKLQPNAVLVTDAHNFETNLSRQFALSQSSIVRKAYFLLASSWNRKLEKQICELSNLLFATSEVDAAAFRALSPLNNHKVIVIPNFIDMKSYELTRAVEKDRSAPILILPGTMSFFPNVIGALHFNRSIYPILKKKIPGITWHIVGRDCHPDVAALAAEDPSIVVTGYVPDISAYMRKASVVIVPLLQGGGTRLKILEAWAHGTPVVSTMKGAEGLVCEDGRDILLADEPQAFADAVTRLIKDNEFASFIADNAFTNVLQRYEREAVKLQLLQLFGLVNDEEAIPWAN